MATPSIERSSVESARSLPRGTKQSRPSGDKPRPVAGITGGRGIAHARPAGSQKAERSQDDQSPRSMRHRISTPTSPGAVGASGRSSMSVNPSFRGTPALASLALS